MSRVKNYFGLNYLFIFLFGICLSGMAYGLAIPTTTTGSSASNLSNTGYLQYIQSQTQKAEKSFKNVNYQKLLAANNSFWQNNPYSAQNNNSTQSNIWFKFNG